jgi:two-component system response regulator ArlR
MMIERFLDLQGYDTKHSYTGDTGLEMALSNKFDLTIIDIGLPDISGLDVLGKLKSANQKPIIIITGDGNRDIELQSYKLRSNIFHKKPLNYEILGAQIKSLLPQNNAHSIKSLDLYIDMSRRVVKLKNQTIYLTNSEFNLLSLLVFSRGEIFSRETILSTVMNYYRNSSVSSVNTLVSRLRKKLSNSKLPIIQSVPKVGYCINSEYLENLTRI